MVDLCHDRAPDARCARRRCPLIVWVMRRREFIWCRGGALLCPYVALAQCSAEQPKIGWRSSFHCRAFISFAKERGRRWLQRLATAGNAYDRDDLGGSTRLPPGVGKQQEFRDGVEWDMPILNVFHRAPGEILEKILA